MSDTDRSFNMAYLPLIQVILTVFICLSASAAIAQEMDVIAGGEMEYQQSCAVCHGIDARGQGNMTKYLTVRPPDLTVIAKKNSGRFPFWRVYQTIDGRTPLRGHSTREMPVWGARFQAEAKGDDVASRSQVSGRILGLVLYLQHIQR